MKHANAASLELQTTAAMIVLIAALGRSRVWAGGTPAALDQWAREQSVKKYA